MYELAVYIVLISRQLLKYIILLIDCGSVISDHYLNYIQDNNGILNIE